jgi:endonuclease YncB( thermonuclease family)
MRKHYGIALFSLAFACFLPAAAHAAEPVEGAPVTIVATAADALAGRVLIDAGRHGEAWYVNPQSRMKVFLGRPADALERLKDRAVFVSFGNIARLAETADASTDAAYGQAVAGDVLAPDDLVGAAWYVNPATGLRMRLATADDAWLVMRTGSPVPHATIDAIPTEPPAAPKVTVARVLKAVSGDTLELTDGKKVRLLSVSVPSNPDLQAAAMARLDALSAGRTVLLEKDGKDTDANGTEWRFVHAGPANLSYELVRGGLAFQEIDFPNYKYAELLIVGSIDAERLKKGFWNR